MLTRKAKYALKAMLVLARKGISEPVFISDLAKRSGVPKKFLELILLDLRNAGLLESKRGKAGGYLLGLPAQDIMVGQVIRAVDGPMAPVPCLSKTAYRRCDDCEHEGECGVRLALREAYQASLAILEKTSLEDTLEMMAESHESLATMPMYNI